MDIWTRLPKAMHDTEGSFLILLHEGGIAFDAGKEDDSQLVDGHSRNSSDKVNYRSD